MTGAPVVLAMSRVSPTWSKWPWVSTMWVTPSIAAALSETKAGLSVKNGSISTAALPKSRRKAEWPYQVICMTLLHHAPSSSAQADGPLRRVVGNLQSTIKRAGLPAFGGNDDREI